MSVSVFRDDGEDGATAVEYGLLVAAVAAVIAAIVFTLGGVVVNTFAGTCNEAKSQLSSSGQC